MEKTAQCRSLLAQTIASLAKDFNLILSGIALSIPTIAIPELTDKEKGTMSYLEASWFASMVPLFLVIGTLLSGFTAAYMGRKRAMLTATVPHMVGMVLLCFVRGVVPDFVGISLLGFGMGLGESAISTYISETSEARYRGMLLAIASIMVQLATLVIFALGSMFTWRTTVLFVLGVPYVTVIIIAIVPEAPLWLISKNRNDDALKTLQWLRGWTTPEQVNSEFREMQLQYDVSKACENCVGNGKTSSCTHNDKSGLKKLGEIFAWRNFAVFKIVIMLFLINHLSGAFPMRPFIIQILRAYGVSIDEYLATVVIGAASVVGKILSVVAIKMFGKRVVGMTALTATFLSLLGLALYANLRFPSNWMSFRHEIPDTISTSIIPLLLFTLYYFSHNFGIESMPFIALCEMFPFRNRCMCTSLSIAIGQLINFAVTKSYIYLETGLTLAGVMWFFASICLIGIFLVYFFMPESEGVSMQQIELFFTDKKRKITDVNIKEFMRKTEELKENTYL